MLTFIGASLILIMIPGPDQALITRNTLVGRRPAGLLTMVGGALGLGVHATAAALGVSAVLAASATAFTALKIVGVAYLVWMGVTTLWASWKPDRQDTDQADGADGSGGSVAGRYRYIRRGFLSNALNPKIALFFLTFLPQFMPGHSATPALAFLYSLVFAGLYLAWFSGYVLLVDRIGAVLRSPAVRARIERVTGFLLLAFAVRLATQQE